MGENSLSFVSKTSALDLSCKPVPHLREQKISENSNFTSNEDLSNGTERDSSSVQEVTGNYANIIVSNSNKPISVLEHALTCEVQIESLPCSDDETNHGVEGDLKQEFIVEEPDSGDDIDPNQSCIKNSFQLASGNADKNLNYTLSSRASNLVNCSYDESSKEIVLSQDEISKWNNEIKFLASDVNFKGFKISGVERLLSSINNSSK